MRKSGVHITILLSLCVTSAGLEAQPMRSGEERSPVSGTYKLRGDKLLLPSLIWDDGSRTFIEWPANVELPAVFAVDAKGSEVTVNAYFRNEHLVIDSVHSSLLFRLDRQVARAERRIAKQP